MSNLINKLKSNEFQVPIWIGQLIAHIPFSWRPMVGGIYKRRREEIELFGIMTEEDQKKFIFNRMFDLVNYSVNNIKFYKDFYKDKGFDISQLKSFDDINRIPIIDKADLMKYDIADRSNLNQPKFLVNTGGSSGYTLNFYVQPSSIGHEWAHIHKMWSILGFNPSDLRLFAVGRSKVRNGIDYEFARHTLTMDIYKPFSEIAPRLKDILRKYPCYYLHGYPSVLAEFADNCSHDQELMKLLKGKLKGAFLNSEYPYPKYRDKIEQVFDIKTQSFYGHTERCVMAFEAEKKFKYIPFQTYGFTEALPKEDGHYYLIGTSYYNLATPLIRYNTKDIIDNPIIDNGILRSFDIIEGRSGQFILDKNGKEISLTGLIMGRHHGLFDCCRHIQIGQKEQGKAIIYYVPNRDALIEKPSILFDNSGVDLEFEFVKKDEPIRNASGKVNLLVLPELMK